MAKKYRWFWVIYVVVGLVVAWEKHYVNLPILKIVFSALLAIFLWWLALLGVSLHVH